MSADRENPIPNDRSFAGWEYETPTWIWQPLADAVGGFDLDPASGAESEPIADERYTIEDNGLTTPWHGRVYVNPPYGGTPNQNPLWAERIAEQAQNRDVTSITALIPGSMSTRWWQDHYSGADLYTLVDAGKVDASESVTCPRVTFRVDGEPAANNASFPSLILSYGDFPEAYYKALDGLATFHFQSADALNYCED